MVAAAPSITLPPAPRTAEETGLPFSFLCDLALKILYFNGGMVGRDLAAHVCLPFTLLEQTLRFLADQGYCSSAGMQVTNLASHEPLAAGMGYTISTTGRARAREVIDLNQYAGPAPVPIATYSHMVEQQRAIDVPIDRARMHATFAHLVLPESVLDHLGPALSARMATFIYGPPGNGKTSIADAAGTLLGPPIFVPRALYVHGEVIRFLDPVHHIEVDRDLPEHDRRWMLAERPVVKVGGELQPQQLDLGFDPTLGFYEASLQLKANGGLFLIDDFGRQQNLSPRDLLNRLIVPLEKGLDYLNIARAGTSIAVPFTSVLLLSTNLRPQNLMDEAFLRRVRFKVHVPNPTAEDYLEIWRRTCVKEGVVFNLAAITRLMQKQYADVGRDLHGAHPRDLLNHTIHVARYMGRPVQLDEDLLDLACATYFVEADV